uniref:(northern house mosquito) hypothetical protein n=1 Tax=Culex pipiens TaxID=7175 RepID=A0A8D8PH88_CULPI
MSRVTSRSTSMPARESTRPARSASARPPQSLHRVGAERAGPADVGPTGGARRPLSCPARTRTKTAHPLARPERVHHRGPDPGRRSDQGWTVSRGSTACPHRVSAVGHA